MGAVFSLLYGLLFRSARKYKVVVVGLDNAGKTTALYRLQLGEVVCTTPTVGANVEEVTFQNVRFECWDLGGQHTLRLSWDAYFKETDAVILVVDSTDRLRATLVKLELQRLLESEDLAQAAVLVFANKQDLKDAMSVPELTDALGLQSERQHSWHVQPSCSLTGEGLHDGLAWLVLQVTKGSAQAAALAPRVSAGGYTAVPT